MYLSKTRSISVSVEPQYLAGESEPSKDRYFWAYRVVIQNNSSIEVQLLSRYWKIINESGRVEEVRGEGVVGETPILAPGEQFEYTSGCPLNTPSGIMGGSYQMAGPDGEMFEIEIPTFSLDIPDQPVVLN